MKQSLLIVHLGAVALWGCIMGCADHPSLKQIVFVLPDQFAGPFIIVESPRGSQLVERDNVYEVAVPTSGVLVVTSQHPFEEMRHWRARFSNGTEVPIYEVEDADVALRGGQLVSRNYNPPRAEFFVGTAKGFEECDFVATFGD